MEYGNPSITNSNKLLQSSLRLGKLSQEIAKGTLYKTTAWHGNFTKEHDVETTVFGDFLTKGKGLNGYPLFMIDKTMISFINCVKWK